jgi:hypothetical protein
MLEMDFSKLEIEHYHELKPFFKHQTFTLSSYSLQSLIVWRDLGGFELRYKVVEGNLWFYAYHAKRPHLSHLILPIGERKLSPRELHKKACEFDVAQYWFVPENYVEKHREALEHYFELREQPEYEDYIYRTTDMAELAGKKYSKKRNLISQFERETLANHQVDIREIRPADFAECVEFLEKWCKSRDCAGDGDISDAFDDNDKINALMCEKRAMTVALENIEKMEWRGIQIRIDNVVSGIGISAPLTEDMGVLCFEKALLEFKGLAQYLDRECARHLFVGRFTYINKESDMGEEGLRQAKASYFPVKTVKSYQLKARVIG